MSKRTRNILLAIGILFSLVLVGLRAHGALNSLTSGFGMISELIGYDGPRHYAVFLFDKEEEPLLLLVDADKGEVKLHAAAPAAPMLNGIQRVGFEEVAPTLIKRVEDSSDIKSIDAAAFITTEAAGEVLDAFDGVSVDKEKITSKNLHEKVSELVHSPGAVEKFNTQTTVKKTNLVTNARTLLFAAKNVFSKRMGAAYFKNSTSFGKPCIGACGVDMLVYSSHDGTLKQ